MSKGLKLFSILLFLNFITFTQSQFDLFEHISTTTDPSSLIFHIEVAHDNSMVAVASFDYKCYIYDISGETISLSQTLTDGNQAATSIKFTDDKEWLIIPDGPRGLIYKKNLSNLF